MTYQRKQEYEFDAKDTFVVRKPFKSNGRNYVSGNAFDKGCVSDRRLRQMVVSGHLVPEDRIAEAPVAPVVIVEPVVEPVVEDVVSAAPVVVADEVIEESEDAVLEGAVTPEGDLVEVEANPEGGVEAPVEASKEIEVPVKRGPGRPKVK